MKRFIYFGIGMLLGSVLVISLLGIDKVRQAVYGWLPTPHIKNEILSKEIYLYSSKIDCLMECLDLSEAQVRSIIQDGEILFDQSRPRDSIKQYMFENTINTYTYRLLIARTSDEKSDVLDLQRIPELDCNCGQE
jgi:hypothetical protein